MLDIQEKLSILADAAKFDAACTSSGHGRTGKKGQLGSAVSGGICHSFTPDGRCVSLLKVLQTNICCYNCEYCINRATNDLPRTAFSSRELADLTIAFYRRNYIEGLFLSSAVVNNPDHTMALMFGTISILRDEYNFGGYIHAKCIPGASQEAIDLMAVKVDRISVNIELPSQKSLSLLAPEKSKTSIITPMGHISQRITSSRDERLALRNAPLYAPAGQATQMIIGATEDSDMQIIRLSEGLYKQFRLKRVFFSAYIPIGSSPLLPQDKPAPLLREHRLYQADWLMRFYGFAASEILEPNQPNFNIYFDPKCDWALRHLESFPIEVNKAPKEMLLRVPGFGVRTVERIIAARRISPMDFIALKRIGAVLKRAKYFITCNGKTYDKFPQKASYIADCMLADYRNKGAPTSVGEQLSLLSSNWDNAPPPLPSEGIMALHGEI